MSEEERAVNYNCTQLFQMISRAAFRISSPCCSRSPSPLGTQLQHTLHGRQQNPATGTSPGLHFVKLSAPLKEQTPESEDKALDLENTFHMAERWPVISDIPYPSPLLL